MMNTSIGTVGGKSRCLRTAFNIFSNIIVTLQPGMLVLTEGPLLAHGTFESCAVQPNKSKDMFILSDQLTKQCICLLGNYNS